MGVPVTPAAPAVPAVSAAPAAQHVLQSIRLHLERQMLMIPISQMTKRSLREVKRFPKRCKPSPIPQNLLWKQRQENQPQHQVGLGKALRSLEAAVPLWERPWEPEGNPMGRWQK